MHSREYAERLELVAGTKLPGQMRALRDAAAERERQLKQALSRAASELAKLKRERLQAADSKELLGRAPPRAP